MKNKLETLNTAIVEFMKQTSQLEYGNFDYHVAKAKDFADMNTSTDPKDLIDLITMKQDGTYPGLPTFEVAQLGVHILWAWSENTDLLMKVVEAKKAPWYVKTEALECLRLTTKAIPWPKIIKLIKKKRIENEVKKAALSVMVFHDRDELLPRLKILNLNKLKDDYFSEELYKHLVFTRASLGDKDVIIPLLEYRNDPWGSTNQPAEAAWIKLTNKRGGINGIADTLLEQSNLHSSNNVENIWTRLQRHENTTVLRWAITEAPLSKLQIKNCLNYLSNPVWEIRKSAADWLIKNQIDAKHFLNILSDQHQDRIAQSWAAYVISKTKGNPHKTLEPYLKNHDIFKVPWTFEAPEAVRDAIVTDNFSTCENGTDIRYTLEYEMYGREPYIAAEPHRDELIESLKKQGLTIEYCKSVGEFYQQGAGNYWITEVLCENAHIYLRISTLGKFIECVHKSEDFEMVDTSPEAHPIIMLCKTEAQRLGFLWLESELLDNYVPDLNVYFFGSRNSLQIRDLLFYWQD